MLGIELKAFLGLTVMAAVVTVFGNLVALYLKEFLASRSLDTWRARQALIAVYERYRKPIAMAAEEISGRCYEAGVHPQPWRADVGPEIIRDVPPDHSNSSSTSHYRRYKLLSDAYRLCCLFGWLELYRRDLGLLDGGTRKKNRDLDDAIRNIRSALADGQLNVYSDRDQWRDTLILREEQRAIGHRMIVPAPGAGLIDFGAFCEQIERGDAAARWFSPTIHFFANIRPDRDFRRYRYKLLVIHLNALRELLQPGSVLAHHVVGTKDLVKELAQERKKMNGTREF